MSYYALAYSPPSLLTSSRLLLIALKNLKRFLSPQLLQLALACVCFYDTEIFSFAGERIFFLVSFSTLIRQAREVLFESQLHIDFASCNALIMLQGCRSTTES